MSNFQTHFRSSKDHEHINKIGDEIIVNCWSASEHESHALWRIFCGAQEGVAVQTTLRRLSRAAENIRVQPVFYMEPRHVAPLELMQATVKRPAFSYENEVRIIAQRETKNPKLIRSELGFELPIDLSIFDAIAIHPEADASFMNIVKGIIDVYAKELGNLVRWSSMREKPPSLR